MSFVNRNTQVPWYPQSGASLPGPLSLCHRLGSAVCSPTCGSRPLALTFVRASNDQNPARPFVICLPVVNCTPFQPPVDISLTELQKQSTFSQQPTTTLAKSASPAQRVLLLRRVTCRERRINPSDPPKRTPESFEFRTPRQSP